MVARTSAQKVVFAHSVRLRATALLVCACLAALTIAYAIGPKRLHIGDSYHYVAMARGEPQPAPFGFRILVPSIVRALPLPPERGFFLMTYAATLGLLLLMYRLLLDCGISRGAAGLTVILMCFSYPIAYYLGIWGLIDPLPNMLAIVTLLCITRGWLVAAAVAVFVASLAKETSLLLVPILCVEVFRRTRSVVTTALLTLLPITGYALVRHSTTVLPGAFDISNLQDFQRHIARQVQSNLREDGWGARVVREFLRSYGFFWVLAVLGLRHARTLKAHSIYLIGCGVALCLLATDWSRMLGNGFIGVFVPVGYFLDALSGRHFRVAAAALTALAVCQGYLALLGYHNLSTRGQIALVAGSVLVFAAGATFGITLRAKDHR